MFPENLRLTDKKVYEEKVFNGLIKILRKSAMKSFSFKRLFQKLYT